MSHELEFHPKDGLKAAWEFVQATIPRLRNRYHVLSIKEVSAKRSNTINNYYFGVVVKAFMAEMGIPDSKSGRNYMHYDVLGKELRQIPDPHRPGETMTEQTSTMSGSRFWKYLGECDKLFYFAYNYNYPEPRNAGYNPDEWEK